MAKAGIEMLKLEAVPKTNRHKFLEKYTELHLAAIGVTVIRTREPLRAICTLQEWSYANRMVFHTWSMISGWSIYGVDPKDADVTPKPDGEIGLPEAIRHIGDWHEKPFGDGTFAVLWPHFALPRLPIVQQMLLELARTTAVLCKRIALIVPNGFEIPLELQDSVFTLDFDLPSRSEMRESYDRVLSVIADKERPRYLENEIETILNILMGMTESEAENAIALALSHHTKELPNVRLDDFCGVLKTVKVEAIRRSSVLELMESENISSVGGLNLLKDWLQMRKHGFGAAARAAGVDKPRGILLVGPPGGGKSLAAKAAASVLGLPLIKFHLNRVYGSLVGESERKIAEALKTIDACAPCVVLIDELDKAVSSSNTGATDSGISTRILGAILTHMQDSEAEVFWVLTANRTANLPSELVRKGRIDEVWSVLMPSEVEREAILRIHIAKRKRDPASIPNLITAVERSNGFVGSEIEQAVKDAVLESFATNCELTGDLIAGQFGKTKPISEAFAADFEHMTQWAQDNARASSSNTAPVRVRQRRKMQVPQSVGHTEESPYAPDDLAS